MNVKDALYYSWFREQNKIGADSTEEAFEEYINRLSNVELLREISYQLGDIPE